MSNDNEKVYASVTVSGGTMNNKLTLEAARKEVHRLQEKGYVAYVEKMDDPDWEDVEVVAPITVHQVADSLGHDRDELERFAKELIALIGWEIDHQDGGFMVYTSGPEDY